MKQIVHWWHTLGNAVGFAGKLARLVIYAILLFMAFECITLPLGWIEQTVLGGLTIALAYAIHRISSSSIITLALMFASMLATARYAYWRISTVVEVLAKDGRAIGIINIFFMLVLLSAEAYAFVILFLGYIQTVRPLDRPPVPMPENVEDWPDIDVLIPTYNEPLSVVRMTVFAALNMDYPAEKLNVYVIDDGRREEFREFCEEAGSGYIARKDNAHAKAGNINHALKLMKAPYVVIFDCDHVPTRSFLQTTVGWFIKDNKLGVLQTPHFFYSPDPFERNLDQFMKIPNEGELFYGIVQDGNDLWNATFFCGSCAVIRRTALNEIGGIATETVTEDAHTSLRMQMRGWNTAYIGIPQAAGLATESLSGHVGQRIRWARGMVQILRTDNPLFAKGLKWPQRLCYFNAMLHFFYAMPRLLFLTAPLVYMLLGHINIPGYWVAILVYSMPHLFLANMTNFRIQGKYRHSFWNEVYETVLAPYILGPTLLALINPKLGKFNVTAKGGLVKQSYFDARIARPYVFLILLNIMGLLIAPVRLIYWNPGHPGTILMNVFWILFNLVILGTANAVAFESRQLRTEVRLDLHMPFELRLPGGQSLFGKSIDMSFSGAMLELEKSLAPPVGAVVRVIYPQRDGEVSFPARIVSVQDKDLRIAYEGLSIQEDEDLTLLLYGGADTWLSRSEQQEPDRPLRSFLRLVRLSVRGVKHALIGWIPRRKSPIAAAVASVLLLVAALFGTTLGAQEQHQDAASAPTPAAGTFHTIMTLRDAGISGAVVFRGVIASRNVPFTLPQSQIVQQASIKVKYSFSPGLIAQMSHLNVYMNNALLTSLPVPQNKGEPQNALETVVPIPAELLIRDNILRFEFVGHYTQKCEDPANTVLWGRIEDSSALELSGSLLALADDLKILPLPFYDGAASSFSATIPFAFVTSPDKNALTAAGIVSSWFGTLARSRPLRFPVTVGRTLPKGNIILFIENPSDLPAGIDVNLDRPVVAVRGNPSDPYGKVLIIAGTNADQLLVAARALVLGGPLLQGRTAPINKFQLPSARAADDAPLWMKTDSTSSLSAFAGGPEMQSDGSGPLPFYVRVPPDLYYGDRQSVRLHLDYRYNAISVADASTLRISANGAMVNDLPLPRANNSRNLLSYDSAVPLANIRPFSNTFLFNFYFQQKKTGYCEDSAPINLQGAILPTSYLDLRGLKHWATMPNLELFANAGFPFTRFADLSQTRIILPHQPTTEEVALYLTLMAYFSEQTGYPALRVQVGDSSDLGADMDYLLLGMPTNDPSFEQLRNKLPVTIKDGELSIHDTRGFFPAIDRIWWKFAEVRPKWWWKLAESNQRDGLITSLSQFPDAVLQAIESPWKSGRSVVVLTVRNKEATDQFTDGFWKSSMSGDISDSVSVLHGTSFSSFRMQDSYYHVGHLGTWAWVRFWLRTYPWLIAVLTFLLGLVVVPWTKQRLDRRAKDRLDTPTT